LAARKSPSPFLFPEALRLGLAYEYDPYFSLSIARVDPLPHQLEAVYDYFMRLPRIRFLLADDPGAGKTIMAGLLVKELKIRGLIQRILILTPANLTFQWQRELKDKFRENFEIIRSDVLRANYGSNPWQDKNQVITSISWVSRIDDARESLLRSRWDLVIVDEVDSARFRAITESALEGLAKRELNLSAIVGKSAEARERRLVPEVIEDFFVQAAPLAGLDLKPVRTGPTGQTGNGRKYRLGRVPRNLWPIGERLEPRFGKLGREYSNIVFDKEILKRDATLEWVTPGHALFEVVRENAWEQVQHHVGRGSIFYDLQSGSPYRLDVFSASIRDGRGRLLNKRLFVVQTAMDGYLSIKQATIFLDLIASESASSPPSETGLPDRSRVEMCLLQQALQPMLEETAKERTREVSIISRHIEISLGEIINRENLILADLISQKEAGSTESGLDGRIKISEDKLLEMDHRIETRRRALEQERQCSIGDIHHIGRAWVLPHPERQSPGIAPMVSDPEIERIASNSPSRTKKRKGELWRVWKPTTADSTSSPGARTLRIRRQPSTFGSLRSKAVLTSVKSR
jgi:hypothetical protein